MKSGLLEAYTSYLPLTDKTPHISLGEGSTPLVYLPTISRNLSIQLYVKLEGANPTGSFKDRGMVMAVAKAMENGSNKIICASTGNTSASAAAYAAHADLECIVLIPRGKIAKGKLAQAMMYGAKIVQVDGNFDDALRIVQDLAKEYPITLVNSVNPYRIEGQKTAAFEIIDVLGKAPDYVSLPVGNAGNITAYWKGFTEYNNIFQTGLPKLAGYQAEGAAAIVQDKVILQPETIATAIRIGNPASRKQAMVARDHSNGWIKSVTDHQIIEAYQLLAKKEGILAEPSSCSSVAGVIQQVENGEIPKGSQVVAILTGNGLKDTEAAIDYSLSKTFTVEGTKEAVKAWLEAST
ncbi:threonine synthase [Mangrovibacillus cuniculi]|uniref:Threonine synthase n=1 Tax=Mangrovibacillus cuniculi TaxID=2593652 RepID=A0A7S8CAL9_9BACI|nr:threonine synthase [Mangrovibacillus cuniculi]QPC46422.1 threonine synthase [Mangrovibacillus cuniculi]